MTISSTYTFLAKAVGVCMSIVLLLSVEETDAFRRILSLSRYKNQEVKVNQSLTINLYYESLCPDCVEFISQKLCPLWEESRMSNYFKIEFVPYGNAETIISKTGEISFECQHGPPECAGNIIHACALKHLGYKDSVKFICCMESRHNAPGSGPICAEELEVDYSQIDSCASGQEGIKLHYLLGKQTANLKPSHEYVPWILFNGLYNKEDMDHAQDDLLGIICKYIQDPKPDECNEVY